MRRVGANDTLTKPFQSIRNLIDKVGILVGGRRSEEQTPTAELPHPRPPAPEPERLSEEDLQITTADTLPLQDDHAEVVAYYAAKREAQAAKQLEMDATTETKLPDVPAASQTDDSAAEVLLDLSDVKRTGASIADDFVLDLDLDEPAEPSPAVAAYSAPSFMRRQRDNDSVSSMSPVATMDRMARPQEFPRISEPSLERVIDEPEQPVVQGIAEQPKSFSEEASTPATTAPLTATASPAGELSPEMIDTIARRAVEQLSEKVVQEIAWEVVPQLAELMIKRQIEEKNS